MPNEENSLSHGSTKNLGTIYLDLIYATVQILRQAVKIIKNVLKISI